MANKIEEKIEPLSSQEITAIKKQIAGCQGMIKQLTKTIQSMPKESENYKLAMLGLENNQKEILALEQKLENDKKLQEKSPEFDPIELEYYRS